MKHIVGFSGGIDSQACAGVVLDEHGPENVILLNSQAGRNEHPLTVEHVKWYSENIHPVIDCVPLIKDLGNRGTKPGAIRDRRSEYSDDDEMDFADLAYIKGRFPSRKAQFCTEHLKLAPQRRWCIENLTDKGIEFVRYAGVRRDESNKRRSTPDSMFDDYFDCDVHFPIAAWTKQQCFDFCKARGERINPLYTLGFSRVGCAPCVNSNKEDIREWAARFPEMIDKVREWEKRVGRTFFHPVRRDGVITWVDEVVEWAKTTRGGSQLSILADVVEPCSSKYGLCE